MAHVRFTKNIQRHIVCPDAHVDGATVRAVLEAYFAAHPQARGYVVDDQQALRKHMAVFVDGAPIRDRAALSDLVRADGKVDVMQALSGG